MYMELRASLNFIEGVKPETMALTVIVKVVTRGELEPSG
jgi:hypothetical protein